MSRVLAKGYHFGDTLRWPRSIVQEGVPNLHLHCLGSSGSGKTRFLYHLACQDIERAIKNPGQLCVIVADPHGDMLKSIQNFIARRAESDFIDGNVIVVDPVDQKRGAVGVNILQPFSGTHPYEVIDETVSCFKSIWKDAWGARMEDILRHSCLLLQEYDLSLAQMPRLLTDKEFRLALVERSENRDIKLYWQHHFDAFRDSEQRYFIESTRNKISAFLSNPYLKPILSQGRSTINFYEAMNSGKIILVNLARSHLKTESRRLFGILLFSKIHQAIISRDDIPEKERTPTSIYIDEAHEIFHPDIFCNLLEGGRKYGVILNLFHQSLSQLQEDDTDILLGNCATLVCFSVARLDAERMAKETFSFSGKEIKYQDGDLLFGRKGKPTYYSVQEELENSIKELMTQRVGECFIRMKNKNIAPYIATTIKVEYPEPSVELEEKLKAASAQKYNRPLETIYRELEDMENQFLAPNKTEEPETFRE